MNVIEMNGAAQNALAIEDERIATSLNSPIGEDAFWCRKRCKPGL